jgi:hypothetical protein
MNPLVLIELAHAAEEDKLRDAMSARVRAEARRETRRLRGPGRTARAWSAFWAPRDMNVAPRGGAGDSGSADLAICTDC